MPCLDIRFRQGFVFHACCRFTAPSAAVAPPASSLHHQDREPCGDLLCEPHYCLTAGVVLWLGRTNSHTVRGMSVAGNRSGKIKVGTLIWLVVLVAAVYVAFEFRSVYWRQYKVKEVVEQQLAYAGQLTDDAIRENLLDEIAALGVPREGFIFYFRRITQPQALEVSISYVETVNLVFTTKKIPMSLQIRRSF